MLMHKVSLTHLTLLILLAAQSCSDVSRFHSTSNGRKRAVAHAEWDLMRLRDPATGKIPRGMRMKELAFARTFPIREEYRSSKNGTLSTTVWQQRGPANQGGRTRALAIDV